MTNRQASDQDEAANVSIRQLVGEQVSNAPSTPNWDEISHRSGPQKPDERRGRVLVGAVTVGLVALLVVGVAVIARSTSSTESINDGSRESTEGTGVGSVPVLLSDTDALSSGDWVFPSWLPAGIEYQYALTDPFGKMAWFGSVEDSDQLMMTTGFGAGESGGEPVEIAGFEWSIISDDGFGRWSATRQLGSTVVTIGSSEVTGDSGIRLIEGLTIVPEDALPSPPLGCANQAVDVAEFGLYGAGVAETNLGDRTFTFAVEESNGYLCSIVGSDSGGGSSCCERFDPDDQMTLVGGGVGSLVDDPTVVLDSAGIVSLDVVRVEVDFINDVTVTVEPTDLSGTFDDSRFWVAAVEVELEPGRSADNIHSPILEVRGYDAEGVLLVTRRGF